MMRATLSTLWLVGVLAADDVIPAAPPTNWVNIGLIVGILAALSTAAIALYRASAQRGLDLGTKKKIDEEVKRLQVEHDERRTKRVLRLELYVDKDIAFHRLQNAYLNELTDLLEQAIEAGFMPAYALPSPPIPPQLPDMPDTAHGDPV